MMRKVLIAEDNQLSRQILRRILCNEYEVIEAANGKEALRLLHKQHKIISAVLLDISMPIVDGFEVLRQMRANAALAQIPVIIATAHDDEETEVKALSLGANDFVTKPYNAALILHCLRNTINLRETASIVNAIQHDKLTGLYNRETFFDKVTAMIAESAPGYYVMACFDIDGFKVINDQYGAGDGDLILQQIGRAANECFSCINGISSRISADNFAALYPAGEQELEYVTRMWEERFTPRNTHTAITYSVGRYIVNDLSLTASAIYDRAYIAKQSVKGRYDVHTAYFDESMREKLLRDQEIISDMDAALALGQFDVWFQPQFNHASGSLTGAEALVRWNHPRRGMIPPDKFIPVFEQNGFVYELDKFVWKRVCRLLHKWLSAGLEPLPVSVNVSRYDIFREDFFGVLTGLLEKNDVPVNLLHLEITESAFAVSTEQIISIVRRLTEYGFVVEIDDFGSGYSSLNILKDVPTTVLKLDMRFLQSSGDSQRGGNILESVVRMAKWLNMAVIAEGVETLEQADYLGSIGCTSVQGYLYARPMPEPEYEAMASGLKKEPRLPVLRTAPNLDNNTFWDPASMDTLIFNSYVGGACIFEYCEGHVELLRANEQYALLIGGAGLTVEKAMKLNWGEHLGENDRELLRCSLEKSRESGSSVSAELLFINLPDGPAETWLHSTMRVIASSGNRYLVYCMNENTTAQRLAERQIIATDAQLRFLNETAHELLAQADTAKGLENVLAKLLDYFDGSRAYIFEFDNENELASNTYEVVAGGIAPEKDNLQGVPFEICPFRARAFETNEYIDIADVSALGDERERETLEARGIRSLFAVPLRRDGELIGLVGIDDPRREHSRINRLVALGDYIAVMLTRRDLDAKIRNDNKTLLGLMNDTPGGFARLRRLPDGTIVPVYFNDGFCKLVGMSSENLMERYGGDVIPGIHPDDLGVVSEMLSRMMESGKAASAKYRIQDGSGGYVRLIIYGSMTRSNAGEVFLNLYIASATEENRLETLREELLENLPCGAGIYELTGETIRATYLNKRYRAYLHREIGALSTAPVFEVVHPDDLARLREALSSAVLEECEGSCDIRIKDGEGGYIPFRVTGNVMERGREKTSVYVTYSPISKEELTFRDMVPIALEAMMLSSSDFSFVKDGTLRYVCCSRAGARFMGFESEKDILGKSDRDIFPAELADRYAAEDRRILATGESLIDNVEQIRMPDGSVRYTSTSKYVLRDSSSGVIGLYGISRDITDTREADSQLKLLAESIPGGLATFVYSPRGIKATYFNDGFCRLLGFSREECAQRESFISSDIVCEEDIQSLGDQLTALYRDDTPASCVFRIHKAGGGHKWINLRAVVADRHQDTATVNAVLFDVTEQQEFTERLRISEEEHRLAVKHSGNIICRYNVATKTATMSREAAEALSMPQTATDVPYGPVDAGLIAPESAETYIAFFESILLGEAAGAMTFQQKTPDGWRWLDGHFSTIFSAAGEPVSAVISFYDITEQLEKESVYKKWQQSLHEKEPSSYTLIRCNLSRDASFDTMEGALLARHFSPDAKTFSERTTEYAEKYVIDEDRELYRSLLNADSLLAGYYRRKRSLALDYREKTEHGDVRWLRLTVDLVEYPGSTDIEAYLMYENIDDNKRAELLTIERAETDPLTGALNRTTFVARADKLVRSAQTTKRHALMILDIDGFKMVNDVFGHSAGDQVLTELADSLRLSLRRGDLLGRLGGDEFLIFLYDIPNDAIIINKAKQLGALVRKSFSVEVQISASIGIVVFPRDGEDFETLYRKADTALYHVKGTGKDSFAFYSEDMSGDRPSIKEAALTAPDEAQKRPLKRRMLIVDDNRLDYELLQGIFKDEFTIDKAKDGASALIRLRHYGSAISVVLLDLLMPGMDGYAVLERMQSSSELQGIPVVVVSGDESRESSLRAIRCGASDFVTKPVDADLLRIRVHSAISKAENERLRAQNSFLELQSTELDKYRLVFERNKMIIIELDWSTGAFTYDPAVGEILAGDWDRRKLWLILLSDMVADVLTVKRMQELVHDIAENRQRLEGSMLARLKTITDEKHLFRMTVYKRVNEYQLADKLVITLKDTGGV